MPPRQIVFAQHASGMQSVEVSNEGIFCALKVQTEPRRHQLMVTNSLPRDHVSRNTAADKHPWQLLTLTASAPVEGS